MGVVAVRGEGREGVFYFFLFLVVLFYFIFPFFPLNIPTRIGNNLHNNFLG